MTGSFETGGSDSSPRTPVYGPLMRSAKNRIGERPRRWRRFVSSSLVVLPLLLMSPPAHSESALAPPPVLLKVTSTLSGVQETWEHGGGGLPLQGYRSSSQRARLLDRSGTGKGVEVA